MAVDCTRALLLIVGLGPGVAVTGVQGHRGGPLRVGVELTGRRCCWGCGGKVWAHGSSRVALADLPAFGRAVRLVWRKRRWRCPDAGCAVGTFTDQDPAVAPPRARMTSRAARWATRRAGRARAISEIAAELGCTDGVTALGLDEILMFRRGPFREKHWGTTIVDTRRGVLLDIVAGRSAAGATRWIQGRTSLWRQRVR